MKATTAIILAVVLTVAVVYLAVRNIDFSQPEAGDAEKTVFASRPAEPTKLTVKPAEGPATVFLRAEGQWRIAEPVAAPAVDRKVQDLVALVEDLRYEQALSPEGDEGIRPADAGLDSPLWTLTLTDANGTDFTLHVGRSATQIGTTQPRTYVRPAGEDRIFVVARDYADLLARPLREYRKLQLLNVPPRRILRVSVDGAEKYTLRRSGEDWVLIDPVSVPADEMKVSNLLGELSNLEAQQYVDEAATPTQLARYGLGEPRLIVTFLVAPPEPATTRPTTRPAPGPTTHKLALSAKTRDRVFVRMDDDPAVYAFDNALLDNLQPKLKNIRSKQLMHAKTADVSGVTLRLPDGSAELAKTDGGWNMVKPHNGPADNSAVRALLAKLTNLRVERFIDEVPSLALYGLADPRAELTVAVPGRRERLLIGRAGDANEVFIRTDGTPGVAVVNEQSIRPLLANPAGYWHTRVLDVKDHERITRIRLSRPGSRTDAVAVPGKDDTWQLLSPVKAPADEETVQGILHQAKMLTGLETVALGKLPDRYAKAADRVSLTLTLTPKRATTQPADGNAPDIRPREVTLHVARLEGSAYVWKEGAEPAAVRKFSAGLYADLSAELRNRDVFDALNAGKLDAMTIEAGDTKWQLTQKDANWSAAGGADVNPRRVADLAMTLADLRLERFVEHDQAEPRKFGLDKPEMTFSINLVDGEPVTLKISGKGPEGEGRYASVSGVQGIFLLPTWRVNGLEQDVQNLAEKDEPAPPEGMPSLPGLRR